MSDLDSGMWDREYPTEEEIREQEEQGSADLYESEEPPEFYDEEFYEDFVEEYDEDEEDQQSLMDNARIRLEQGRLYEMLIKHDLFDGVDALPQAVENVQKEMKAFIMERLEILLGMKSEKEPVQHVTYDSQFNDLEVQVLRRLASKFSKGMTDNAPTTEPEPSQLNTVKKKAKPSGLNSLSSKPKAPLKKATPPLPAKKKAKKPLPKKGSQKPKRKLKAEIADVGTANMTAEEAARRDVKYIESLKNMSLEEANEVVNQRHNRPRPRVEINQDQVNAHYQTRMSMNETANTFTALLAAAKKK